MSDPLEGPRWPSNNITYSFADANLPGQPAQFSSFITNLAYQAVAENAAAAWSAVSGIQFQLVPDSPSVDIRLGFASLNTAQGGVIGSTNLSWSGSYFLPGAISTIEDPSQTPLIPLPDGDFRYSGYQTNLMQVIEHEFGHALGLAHNPDDPNAVMNANASPSNSAGPDQSDIQAIQSLYGPPMMSFAHDANTTIIWEDYLTGLGREPDPAGLAGWGNFLGTGGTAAQLAEQISQSTEFQFLHSQQTDENYVESLYENGLGRTADAIGLQSWVGALQSGSLDRGGVLAGIAQSVEAQNHLLNIA
jgi:hypothetical protein